MTFAEMKKTREAIQAVYNLDSAAAGRVLSYYNGGAGGKNPDIMQQLAAGDLSPVPGILSALGLSDTVAASVAPSDPLPVSSTAAPVGSSAAVAPSVGAVPAPVAVSSDGDIKTPTKRRKRSKDRPQVAAPDLYTPTSKDMYTPQATPQAQPVQMATAADVAALLIDGDILPADTAADDLLPVGLYEDITAIIEGYCNSFNISDPLKIHPLQWQGVCCRIGETIKKRGVLRDRERERVHGGIFYDGKKLVALLALYGVVCSDYKQVAFTFNFQRFSGVSREYFNDYCNRGLTSSRVGIVEKAQELQRSSLVGAVTSGGSATVGNIFLSKALAGLQETVTIQHVSGSAAPEVASLPDFGSVSALPG